ncbi:MAG: hypothetical protein ACSHW2_01990 [Parasphingopyxis sp.]
MPKSSLFLPLALAAMAAPVAAQEPMDLPTPRGTYLVFADETGSAFVSHEPSLAARGTWPLSFFYFRDGAMVGTARIAGTADCAQGVVRGRLTHATGPDGSLMDIPQTEDTPLFAFDRAGGDGDEALVGFVCGTGQERLMQAETPIHADPEATARIYAGLRGLGIENRLARSLAIRDARTAEPLIGTAVPEALRAQVRALLDGQ